MWQSKNKIPPEGEYLVKIDKYYHIGYCEFDGVWTVSGIVSKIDKWREIEDTQDYINMLFIGALLGGLYGISIGMSLMKI